MTPRPLAVAAALSAVVFAWPGPRPAEAGKPKVECFNRREITILRPLDDRHVYAKVGASRHYLLTMDDHCQGLDEARRLQVVDASSRVCPDGTSLLAFEHVAAGPMRCRISAIEPVKSRADAEERAAAEVPASPEP